MGENGPREVPGELAAGLHDAIDEVGERRPRLVGWGLGGGVGEEEAPAARLDVHPPAEENGQNGPSEVGEDRAVGEGSLAFVFGEGIDNRGR